MARVARPMFSAEALVEASPSGSGSRLRRNQTDNAQPHHLWMGNSQGCTTQMGHSGQSPAKQSKSPQNHPSEIGMIVGFVLASIGEILLNYVFELFEYLAFCLRKCPKCGARKWS